MNSSPSRSATRQHTRRLSMDAVNSSAEPSQQCSEARGNKDIPDGEKKSSSRCRGGRPMRRVSLDAFTSLAESKVANLSGKGDSEGVSKPQASPKGKKKDGSRLREKAQRELTSASKNSKVPCLRPSKRDSDARLKKTRPGTSSTLKRCDRRDSSAESNNGRSAKKSPEKRVTKSQQPSSLPGQAEAGKEGMSDSMQQRRRHRQQGGRRRLSADAERRDRRRPARRSHSQEVLATTRTPRSERGHEDNLKVEDTTKFVDSPAVAVVPDKTSSPSRTGVRRRQRSSNQMESPGTGTAAERRRRRVGRTGHEALLQAIAAKNQPICSAAVAKEKRERASSILKTRNESLAMLRSQQEMIKQRLAAV